MDSQTRVGRVCPRARGLSEVSRLRFEGAGGRVCGHKPGVKIEDTSVLSGRITARGVRVNPDDLQNHTAFRVLY